MSVSIYLISNINQNGLEILGVNIFLHCFAGGDDINNVRGTNRRGVAAPLDMVIFESDEYALPG
jgi:hypothetical protein